jgi:hypothetical protein
MIGAMPGRATRFGPAIKGSRYCLQQFVEKGGDLLGREILSASPKLCSLGARDVRWVSPLASENYLEYRDDFLRPLGLQSCEPQLRSFWPAKGPQWDGIATVDLTVGRAILLIEAKAHPAETRSSCSAKDPRSIAAIRRALEEVRTYMGAEACDWTRGAYQLANRLAYLYFLDVKCQIPTFLVLLNFVNDTGHKPTSQEQWLQFPTTRYLGLRTADRLLDHVVTVYPKAL